MLNKRMLKIISSFVTLTHHDGSLAAVLGESMSDCCCSDGLDVGSLSVVVSLLSPRPERSDGAVPDLGVELVSALSDRQLCSG